jgi:hypothetical protein
MPGHLRYQIEIRIQVLGQCPFDSLEIVTYGGQDFMFQVDHNALPIRSYAKVSVIRNLMQSLQSLPQGSPGCVFTIRNAVYFGCLKDRSTLVKMGLG